MSPPVAMTSRPPKADARRKEKEIAMRET